MMFLKKNKLASTLFLAALLLLSGKVETAFADVDIGCDPCPIDFIEMPLVSVYADFLYWEVHPEGLEFARNNGFSLDNTESLTQDGEILNIDCDLEPGFRVGALVNLGCCNWDFYAQYSWLRPSNCNEILNKFEPGKPSGGMQIQPLIYNQELPPDSNNPLNFARAEWKAKYNVLDFGFGRTFSINGCFDFRPYLGCKATWQEIKYNIRYENQPSTSLFKRIDIKNKTEFNGIGLSGGFDAAWRISPYLRLTGGVSLATVWSDINIQREDFYSPNLTNPFEKKDIKILGFKPKRCVLIPTADLLLGLRYDTTLCYCYNVFAFVGWENQIWWNMNHFLYISKSSGGGDSFQFGPHGSITYQGLTVRAGASY